MFFLLIEFHYMGYSKLHSSPEILNRLGLHLITFACVFLFTWIWVIISFIQDLFFTTSRITILDDISFFFIRCSGLWNFLVWIRSPAISFTYHPAPHSLNEVTESLLFHKSHSQNENSTDDSDVEQEGEFGQKNHSVDGNPLPVWIKGLKQSAVSHPLIIIEEGSQISRVPSGRSARGSSETNARGSSETNARGSSETN